MTLKSTFWTPRACRGGAPHVPRVGGPTRATEMLALTPPEPPLSQARGARCGAPGAVPRELILEVPSEKRHAQTWRRSVVSALLEPRRGPGDSWGCEGLVCRTGTRRGRAWKEVSSLVGTARGCSPPSLTAARPLGRAGGSPFPRGAGGDFTDSLRQRASENPEHKAAWTRLAAALGAPSPHRPRRLLCGPGCALARARARSPSNLSAPGTVPAQVCAPRDKALPARF